jgi:UDP-2-acetamido-3-amino-2,3-dideoxy-glucuronate N-acetyltransferase
MADSPIDEFTNVHPSAIVGANVYVRQYSQLRENVSIGTNTKIGRNVYIGPGVTVGENCKIQNNALIYEPATLADGVFVGPGVILTNDTYPRAVTLSGELKKSVDWVPVGVRIGTGASIGAGAICVAPLSIGSWALIGAGSVVINDVPQYALVVGNPAKQIGWVGKEGATLIQEHDGSFVCPVSKLKYILAGTQLHEAN